MRVLVSVWRTAWREAIANRAAFWSQAGALVLNDLVWIAFWFIVFARVDDIRGWRLADVVLLFGMMAGSVGIVLGLFANSRRLAEVITSGRLDPVLGLPVPPLGYLLVRRVDPLHVGDVGFGFAVVAASFIVADDPSPARFGWVVLAMACSTATLAGFLVTLGSLAFFSRASGEVGEMGFHAITLFATYPIDVFGRALRVAFHTAIPAAFVGSVPVRAITEPSLRVGATMVAIAALHVAIGAAVFRVGLRRYTSGAAWVTA